MVRPPNVHTRQWTCKCNFCGHVWGGGPHSIRSHLLSLPGQGVGPCDSVTEDVKDIVRRLHADASSDGKDSREAIDALVDDLGGSASQSQGDASLSTHGEGSTHASGSSKSNVNSSKKRKVAQGAGGLPAAFGLQARKQADQALRRFFYAEDVPEWKVRSPYFLDMIKAIGNVGPSYVPPSYHALRTTELNDEVQCLKKEIMGDKEVCVRMLAAPINPSDINRIEGVYPIGPPPPAVGGNEGVGEVIAVAEGVQNLSVNDWVIPAKAGLGTWRTYVVNEEIDWCKVRRDVPVEYAATAFINPCAALRMLEDFVPLSEGDLLVQNGANSMVGQCVIQLAYARGLQTANIIRDRRGMEEVKRRLKFLGATGTFTETEAESKELLGDLRNAKLGLNCVGGSAANVVMKLLRENGTMVTYGGMSKKPITVSTSAMIFKGIELKGFWLQKWVNRHSPADVARMTDYILGLVHGNKLVYLTEKVPFTEFRKALENALGMHGSSIKQLLTFT
ncbi:hypothetical protein L7F22_013287 [Adiantum nelumboides]|nr:hypothetical protein [Adiantum nelumboides]